MVSPAILVRRSFNEVGLWQGHFLVIPAKAGIHLFNPVACLSHTKILFCWCRGDGGISSRLITTNIGIILQVSLRETSVRKKQLEYLADRFKILQKLTKKIREAKTGSFV